MILKIKQEHLISPEKREKNPGMKTGKKDISGNSGK